MAALLKESGNNETDDSHNVNQDIHGGTGGVLEGVTDGVTDHASGVRVGSFAAIVAVFDVLLGIVPSTTGIGHEKCEKNTTEESSDKAPGKSFGSSLSSFGSDEIEAESNDDWCPNCEKGRSNHAFGGCFGGDIDTAITVWFDCPFEDARFGFKLSADFLDHTASGRFVFTGSGLWRPF